MNMTKLTLGTVLVVLSSVAFAADRSSDAGREQRMDEALQNYRNSQHNDRAGPMARAEESVKRGFHKTGVAIKHGAHEVGHAVSKGAHKTGEALHHAGEKIKGSDAKSK